MSMQLIQKKKLPVDSSGAYETWDFLVNGRVSWVGSIKLSEKLNKPSGLVIVEDPRSGYSRKVVAFNELAHEVVRMRQGETVHFKGSVTYVNGQQQFTVSEILPELPSFLREEPFAG